MASVVTRAGGSLHYLTFAHNRHSAHTSSRKVTPPSPPDQLWTFSPRGDADEDARRNMQRCCAWCSRYECRLGRIRPRPDSRESLNMLINSPHILLRFSRAWPPVRGLTAQLDRVVHPSRHGFDFFGGIEAAQSEAYRETDEILAGSWFIDELSNSRETGQRDRQNSLGRRRNLRKMMRSQ